MNTGRRAPGRSGQVAVALIAVACLLVSSACGSDPNAKPTPSSTPGGATTAAAPASTLTPTADASPVAAGAVAFHPTATVAVDDPRAAVASTVTIRTTLPDASFPRLFAIDIPPDWDLAGWRSAPNGEAIAMLAADLNIGAANGPCNVPVHAEFRLLSASADGATVSTSDMAHPPFPDVYVDSDANGLPDGVDRVPSFLSSFPLAGAPFARAYGQSNVSAFPVFIDLITRDLGADGYRAYLILNDPNFHSTVVTSTCGPMTTAITLFGASAGPARGTPLLRNPGTGDHTWSVRLAPPADGDGDGIDNDIDNCAVMPNSDQADGDADGLGDACDPSPAENHSGGDEDGDGYPNGADDCPLVSDPANVDSDFDFLGDMCDDDPHGTFTGPEVVLPQVVSLAAAPADAASIASPPPELASLPPVFDPFARSGDEPPNPSAGAVNPDDAPEQDVGDPAALGRGDCDASWRAARSQQGGWSVCFPASWSYAQDRRGGPAGFWEDSFTLLRGSGSGSAPGGAITIHVQTILKTLGAQLPACASPTPATLGGVAATVCRYAPGDPAIEGRSSGLAYYVDFGNGRIALEGVSYRDDAGAIAGEIEAIFESLRLP